MTTTDEKIELCCRLLEIYNVASKVKETELSNFENYKSQLYCYGNVYSFDYKNKHYYAIDDYSLGDLKKFIKNVILDINPHADGQPLKNPKVQNDGAIYAAGWQNTEYYMWACS